jgi:hypothetical protein
LIDINAENWLAYGCKVAGRNLSDDEWYQYFNLLNYETTCPGD